MKSQKGITLITLTIYIILMTMSIGILVKISSFFTSNINRMDLLGSNISQITKFNMYLLEDIKKSDIQISECGERLLILSDGTTYQYIGNSIYRNKVKICKNISYVYFEWINKDNLEEKQIIRMDFAVEGSIKYTKKLEYVLKYY